MTFRGEPCTRWTSLGAELEPQVEREPAHEVLGALVGVRERPRDRSLAELAVVLGDVRAAAVVEVAGDRVVVVAVDRRDPAVLDQPAHLVRVRAVADQVAAAVDRVDADRVDRLEAGLERREVGVDVGDDRDALQLWPLLRRCRSRGRCGHERLDQLPDVVVELVANPPDDLERLAGGIVDRPVLVALAGVHRARITAARA